VVKRLPMNGQDDVISTHTKSIERDGLGKKAEDDAAVRNATGDIKQTNG